MHDTNEQISDAALNAEPLPSAGSSAIAYVRKVVVFVVGMSVLMIGLAMILLPGPATVVIPIGLAILATEFVWARRWLHYVKRKARDVTGWTMTRTQPPAPPE